MGQVHCNPDAIRPAKEFLQGVSGTVPVTLESAQRVLAECLNDVEREIALIERDLQWMQGGGADAIERRRGEKASAARVLRESVGELCALQQRGTQLDARVGLLAHWLAQVESCARDMMRSGIPEPHPTKVGASIGEIEDALTRVLLDTGVSREQLPPIAATGPGEPSHPSARVEPRDHSSAWWDR